MSILYGLQQSIKDKNSLLFRVVEIQRICEATATPGCQEGANLSEQSNNKRIVYEIEQSDSFGLFLRILKK